MKDCKASKVLPPDITGEDGKGLIDEGLPQSQTVDIDIQINKKGEFSKKLCIAAVIIFTGVAIYSILAYYYLMRLAIEIQSVVTPDASLPIAGITSILAAVMSYCLYQMGLKNSRNKYGIDSEGQPFTQVIQEYASKEEVGPQ